MKNRVALVVVCLAGGHALAQPSSDQPAPAMPAAPMPTTDPMLGPQPAQQTDKKPEDPQQKPKKKEPGRGDFDAGGQARFPSGPDEMGTYESFNWVAADLKGRYYLLDNVWVDGLIPLAIIKPETATINGATVDPRLFGGIQARVEAKLPVLRLALTLGYMREGAMLLSDKDFPLFIGDFKPGVGLAVPMRLKLSSVLDLALAPALVYQSGTMESLTAVQIPLALRVALADMVKVSADLGIYTGDDFSFSGDEGGRISTGAALDVKIGPIALHTGAGVASLLSGGMYPSIKESVYVDVNVKYVK
jgi:hypothetical protein